MTDNTPAERTLDMPWCLCGNEQTDSVDLNGNHVGALCEPFLAGPLNVAYEAWNIAAREWGMCCGSISSGLSQGRTLAERIKGFTDAAHLYLHPKSHGESNYYLIQGLCADCEHQHTGIDGTCIAAVDDPTNDDMCPCNTFRPAPGTEPAMWVECGVRFYADHAKTYWIFDNDKIDSHAEEFGFPVPYKGLDIDAFLTQLASNLADAAATAYMSDYALCPVCHGTYYTPNGPCCGSEDEDMTDDDYEKTYHFKLECTVTLTEKPDPPETLTWLLARELMKQLGELEYGAIGYMIEQDSIYTNDDDDPDAESV